MALNRKMPRDLVIISVNAETDPPRKLDLTAAAPGFASMMDAVSGSQIRRYNFETLELARESMKNWVADANAQGYPIRGHLIEVSFDNIVDPKERARLKTLPTSFKLSDEQVDSLRTAARQLVTESPDFKQLLVDLANQ